MSPRVSPRHLEARRRGILAAAQRCISRNGVRGTTIRDICRAANLSPGAVYRYFPSKDDILIALASSRQQQIDSFFHHLATSDAGGGDLFHRLADLVRRLDNPEALEGLRLDLRLWSEGIDASEVRHPLVEGIESLVRRLEPGLPLALGEHPEATVRLLVALLQGVALQKALDPETDLETVAVAIEKLGPPAGRNP